MIPQPFIHDLLSRIDIVDAVDRHVSLKKAGANYVACCPFHSEKTPSFTVSPTKQFYHCFGCGAHGNAISFLMDYGGMNFAEAVGDLAGQVGMQVPEQQQDFESHSSFETGSKEVFPQSLFEVMNVATRFYQGQLKISQQAIAYLKMRGLTGEMATRFAIGYAPVGWQNLAAAFSDYQSEETRDLLIKAGLLIQGDDGKRYDRFRNRIMFPILDQKGNIVGFGGRVLEQGEPKYLNSPETQLFEKGRELYNFFSARRAIRKAEKVLVVEGYMDVVVLAQHGIDYAVAALGTATTSFHVQKLLRQADNIVFCFDGDRAGQKAAWRALENSLPQLVDGKHLSFLFLPTGEDPDSYVRKFGAEALEQQFKQAVPLSEFLFRELSEEINLQTSEGRAKLVRDAKPLLKQVTAPTFALMLLKRLTELSGTSQSELEDLLQIKRVSSGRTRQSVSRQQPVTHYHRLILILLHSPSYIQKLDRDLLVKCSEKSEEVTVLRALVEFLDAHPNITGSVSTPAIMAYFHDSPYRALLEKIESETLELSDAMDLEAEFSGALVKLQEIQRKQRMSELHSKPLNMLTVEEKQELQRLAIS